MYIAMPRLLKNRSATSALLVDPSHSHFPFIFISYTPVRTENIVCMYYVHTQYTRVQYYINSLDIQSSGCGRGGPTYFKVGDLLYKICTPHYANFQKKYLIRYVLRKVSNFFFKKWHTVRYIFC